MKNAKKQSGSKVQRASAVGGRARGAKLHDLIESLCVVGELNPNESAKDKAAAREKLTAHFKSMLNAKEMASALSQIQTLTERVAKMEKASAALARLQALTARAAKMSKDSVVAAVERAERNHMRSLGRDVPMPRPTLGPTDEIERAGRSVLKTLPT